MFTPQLWQQQRQSAIKEGPRLAMANLATPVNKEYPDMTKRSMPQLTAYVSNYLLDAGLLQLTMHSSKQLTMTGEAADGTSRMGSFVLGLSQITDHSDNLLSPGSEEGEGLGKGAKWSRWSVYVCKTIQTG